MDKIQLGAAESQALLQGDSKSVAKLEKCIYTFTYKHKREDVLGLSPTSQEDAYTKVRKYYQALEQYPDARIFFSTPMTEDARNNVERWARISEDAWIAGLRFEGRIWVQLTNPPRSTSDWVFDGIAVTFIGLSIVVVSGFFVMAVYTFIAHP